MNDETNKTLQELREKAGLSQSELAKRLPYTASRISRLESGETSLNTEEALELAKAIGSPDAEKFAEYLSWSWEVLDRPRFGHISLAALRAAEQALQRLDRLQNDPEIKNAFLKQVDSCGRAIENAARFLASTDHPVVYVGKPGVGKTTAICAQGGLRDTAEKGLQRQMALQTGAGRTTICEVHIRNGGEYSIAVVPCSEENLRFHVADFCDYLLSLANEGG